jgi:general secretion pathway protein G
MREKEIDMQATLERLRQRREERGDEGGFTLIELLIVIVILGILAAIVVFAVQNLTSQSSKASCGSDYKTVETAMETYKAQVGHYPQPADAGSQGALAAGAYVFQTTTDGVTALFNAQPGVDGNQAGPWLKDIPQNGSLYKIGATVTAGGTGDQVQVTNVTNNQTGITCAAVGL